MVAANEIQTILLYYYHGAPILQGSEDILDDDTMGSQLFSALRGSLLHSYGTWSG